MLERALYQHLLFPLARLATFHDAEIAHAMTAKGLAWLNDHPHLALTVADQYRILHPSLRRTVAGIDFPGPLGMAAGFDKHGTMVLPLACLGFAFVVVGTVLPSAQPGNPRPRLFRLMKDRALINRMGFNSEGAVQVARNLDRALHSPLGRDPRCPRVPVGISVSKMTATPPVPELAAQDCIATMKCLAPHADFCVANAASPNSPGLRELEKRALVRQFVELIAPHRAGMPMFLKLSPDLGDEDFEYACGVAVEYLDGLVLTNTTLARPALKSAHARQSGGLSGQPLAARSLSMLHAARKIVPSQFPIMSVGGIFTSDDAKARLDAGADLLKGYTGFVFEGWTYARDIHRGLLAPRR